jgi:hypothetical protein
MAAGQKEDKIFTKEKKKNNAEFYFLIFYFEKL